MLNTDSRLSSVGLRYEVLMRPICMIMEGVQTAGQILVSTECRSMAVSNRRVEVRRHSGEQNALRRIPEGAYGVTSLGYVADS